MQEEIFGPLLPIVAYRDPRRGDRLRARRPRPLALYYFDDDRARIERVLDRTVSGGVTVNDTIYHFAQEALPFGGIGPSGMGAYHGREGFRTFSHAKARLLPEPPHAHQPAGAALRQPLVPPPDAPGDAPHPAAAVRRLKFGHRPRALTSRGVSP